MKKPPTRKAKQNKALATAEITLEEIIEIVIETLRSRHIVESAGTHTVLTQRFNDVHDADAKDPRAPNRLFEFIHSLKGQLQWDWDLGPSDLLGGELRTPIEIAHRAFDVL